MLFPHSSSQRGIDITNRFTQSRIRGKYNDEYKLDHPKYARDEDRRSTTIVAQAPPTLGSMFRLLRRGLLDIIGDTALFFLASYRDCRPTPWGANPVVLTAGDVKAETPVSNGSGRINPSI